MGHRTAGRLVLISILLVFATGIKAAGSQLADAAQKGDLDTVRSLLGARADVNAPQPDGTTALAWAANRDEMVMAELVIAAGAAVNAANDYGVTPLEHACVNGSATMVDKLLKAGANPNSALLTGQTALMTCARTGNAAAVTSLLISGANVDATESRRGQTALMWAVEQGHIDTARALIEHRANVNARSKSGFSALLFAAQQNDRGIVELLLAAGADVNTATSAPSSAAGPPAGTTALLIAAASGHEDLALYLLEKGANPNTADNNGASALHYAVRKGMIMMVSDQQSIDLADLPTWHNMVELNRELLARGANPNARLARNVGRMAINTAGATPFMLATISGDIPLMRMLVASGADPKLATNANVTAFMLAAGVGWAARAERTEEEIRNGLEAAKMLLTFGADVNAAGEYKWTPLHGAAYTGSDAIVEFLVENGARIDAKDVWEQTPLSIAQGFASILIDDFTKKTQGPHPSTAALLQKLGAPPWVPPVRPDAVAPPVTGRGNP